MRYAVLLAVGAPAVAGALALLWPDPERVMGPELGPRAVAGAGILAALAAGGWIAWSEAGDGFARDGFETDPWRALLVLGILAGAGAWLVRRREHVDVLAARLGSTAALTGAVLASDGATAGAFIGAGALCMLWLAVRGHVTARTATWIVVSDVTLLGTVTATAGDGLGAPMSITGSVAWLWAAAVIVRGAVWARADEPGLALGYRMQALWFVSWLAPGDARTGLGLAAATLAVVAARSTARRGFAPALGMTVAMLATTTIAQTETELMPAAAVLAAATAVAGALIALGRARGVLVGLVPAGAALPGVILLAAVLLRSETVAGRLTAVGICAAACYLAAGVGNGLLAPPQRARLGWAVIPLAAGIAVAMAPVSLGDVFAPGGRSLTEVAFLLPTWLVPAAVALILAVSVWSRGSTDDARRTQDGPMVVEATWIPTRRHAALAGLVIAASAVVMTLGLSRGFL